MFSKVVMSGLIANCIHAWLVAFEPFDSQQQFYFLLNKPSPGVEPVVGTYACCTVYQSKTSQNSNWPTEKCCSPKGILAAAFKKLQSADV